MMPSSGRIAVFISAFAAMWAAPVLIEFATAKEQPDKKATNPNFELYCKKLHPGSIVNSLRGTNEPLCTIQANQFSWTHHKIKIGEACRLTTGSSAFRKAAAGKYECVPGEPGKDAAEAKGGTGPNLADRIQGKRRAIAGIKGNKAFVWVDPKTGKKVRQKKFRRLKEPFEYKGEQYAEKNAEAKITRLEKEVDELEKQQRAEGVEATLAKPPQTDDGDLRRLVIEPGTVYLGNGSFPGTVHRGQVDAVKVGKGKPLPRYDTTFSIPKSRTPSVLQDIRFNFGEVFGVDSRVTIAVNGTPLSGSIANGLGGGITVPQRLVQVGTNKLTIIPETSVKDIDDFVIRAIALDYRMTPLKPEIMFLVRAGHGYTPLPGKLEFGKTFYIEVRFEEQEPPRQDSLTVTLDTGAGKQSIIVHSLAARGRPERFRSKAAVLKQHPPPAGEDKQ